MRIVVFHPSASIAQRWQQTLASELPAATVWVWSADDGRQADYGVGWAATTQFFATQPQLRMFFSMGAGVEQLLREPGVPATLPLVRLEDAGMAGQMADYCVHAVLRWMRHYAVYTVQQQQQRWRQLPPEDVAQWPVGIFGLGVLGSHVARVFAAHGFPVHAYVRTPRSNTELRLYSASNEADFEAFLRASRVVVLLAPLTEQTRDRFDRRSLALLPRGAYVINVARGALIVDDDLLELLDAGHLAGAALDVFRTEPLPPTHRFWTHPKIAVTPHVSAITVVEPSARQVAEKIRRLERGEAVSGLVDRGRGY